MFRIFIGYISCLAIASLRLAFIDMPKENLPFVTTLAIAMGFVALISFVPWLICVIIAELNSIRNPLYYIIFAVSIPLSIAVLSDGIHARNPILKLCWDSAAAAAIYWLIAGRHAGENESA